MKDKPLLGSLRVVLLSFEVQLRQNLTDGFVLFGILVQPLLVAFMALWMLKDKGPDHAIFVVIGSGLTGLWTTLLFDGGNSITGERWNGTLEPLVGSPSSMRLIVFGKVLASITQSLLSMVGCYTLISLIMGFPLTIQRPGLFVGSVILTVLALVCFGLIMASLFILIRDIGRMINTLEFPVYILCGFLFPIALLPGWTTPISYLLSPYWAAQALHGAASGTLSVNQILVAWAMMIAFSLAYVLLSDGLYRKILYRARVEASLDTEG
jgi:ABC-2 type transport system permease protein